MPYRTACYPEKDPPIPGPSFLETLSNKWKLFYERTEHIRSEKWILMFFALYFIYMLLAGSVYGVVSSQYFMSGHWGLGTAYALTVMMCLGSEVMLVLFTIRIAKNKL